MSISTADLASASIDLSPYLTPRGARPPVPVVLISNQLGVDWVLPENPRQLPEWVVDTWTWSIEDAGHEPSHHDVVVSTLGCDPAMPRGVPWTSLPVLASPLTTFRRGGGIREAIPYRRLPNGSCDPGDSIRDARAIVVMDAAPKPYPDQMVVSRHLALAKAHAVIEAFRTEDCPITFTLPSGEQVRTDRAGLAEAAAFGVAFRRFRYSYRINATAILAKALRHLGPPPKIAIEVQEASDFRSCSHSADLSARDRKDGVPEASQALADPMALQMLYAMARGQGTGDEGSAWGGIGALHKRGENLGPLLYWRGTGKYPAFWVRDATSLVGGLWGSGLAEFTGNGFRISPRGRALLDLLPGRCEDPDVLGRWFAMADEPDTAKAKMDAWILTFFRAVKRRVNELR